MQWRDLNSHIGYIDAKDRKRIQEAFELGKNAHEEQKRKSGEPYFMHPIAVTQILASMHADTDTLIASLLHDTVEDTDLTLQEIDRQFDGNVSSLIDGVTKLEPEDVAENISLNDQIETLRKIFTYIEQDVRIIIIKLADRLHNIQTIKHLSPERQKKMAQETMDVYVKIADRLSMQALRDELEGLCLQILQPDVYKKVLPLEAKNKKLSQKCIKIMEKAMKDTYPSIAKKLTYEHTEKSWGKLITQLNTAGEFVTGVYDTSIAIVCNSNIECYEALGAIHQLWPRETLSFQDFINAPMINGYHGIHTTVILDNGVRLRCKIRTKEMDSYAHVGIAGACFDGKACGALDYLLPWAEHISPLAEDTKHVSAEFWDSLQNDILGETIIIHRPDDGRILIPKGSTALDGAFYCYGEKALFTRSILVDGKATHLNTLLTHATSLSIETGKSKTVEHEWLQLVESGLAKAHIRKGLSKESSTKAQQAGKDLLQQLFSENKKGYIEEFNEKIIEQAVMHIGYSSLSEVYSAIANGHLDASIVYNALFGDKKPLPDTKTATYKVRFFIESNAMDMLEKVLSVFKRYGIQIGDMTFKNMRGNMEKISARKNLTPKQKAALHTELKALQVQDLSIQSAKFTPIYFSGIVFLLIIWGFDPAIGYRLIHEYSISSIDLTLLRFWSLTIMSAFLLLLKHLRGDIANIRIPIKSKTLWVCALLMISVSLSTYTALKGTTPIHYSIPMTAAGILLTSIVNKRHYFLIAITWLLLFIGIGIIVLFSPTWTLYHMIYTLIAVVSFSLFSLFSERFKKLKNISARSGQYIFVLSALCSVLTLPLLPYATITSLPQDAIVSISAYSVLFAGLPYYLYYYLLSHQQIDTVLKYSFLIIFTTMIGQILFTQQIATIQPSTLLSSAIVSVGSIILLFSALQKRS